MTQLRYTIWYALGRIAYYCLLPSIFVYSSVSAPRTRVIIVHDDAVLAVKNWLGSGRWALPGGGIHGGEDPLSAALREVQEELGLALEREQLLPLGKHNVRSRFGVPQKFHLYACELQDAPIITLQKSEISDMKWLSFKEVKQRGKHVSTGLYQSVMVWTRR